MDSKPQPKKIQYHWDLDVYQLSVSAAMEIYDLSKSFPKEETYSLPDTFAHRSGADEISVSEIVDHHWGFAFRTSHFEFFAQFGESAAKYDDICVFKKCVR